jgi:two-component sensor histidine kinase
MYLHPMSVPLVAAFRKIIDLGVKDMLPFYDKREIRIVNLFALITLFGLLIAITTVFFIKGTCPVATVIFSTVVALASLFFNLRSYYNVATYVFVISINVIIFTTSQQYILAVGNYLYYFPVVFCVALLHNPFKKNVRTIIFFSIILVSFLASLSIDIDSLKLKNITEEDNKVLFAYNCVLTVFLTTILVYLVVRLINRQNNELIQILNKEKESQVVIGNSLKEKEVLLAEIQHRVKNNLAVISGLLNLQLSNAQGDEARLLLLDAKNRVMSIAMAHERLYKKQDLSKINLGHYLQELTEEIVGSHDLNSRICIQKQIVDVDIPITKAVPTGLIINEVLTNSLKHAFSNDFQNPAIGLKMVLDENVIHITLHDNGVGFGDLKERKESSLGISLIESLANQIDAEISFTNKAGAFVELSYPI